MKKLSSKTIYYLFIVCFLSALLFVIILQLRITFKDAFFPYWDPYITKPISEDVGVVNILGEYFGDPLFFYDTRILNEVSTLDYYDIIKYGNLFCIFLLFIILYLVFKEILNAKKNSDKLFIIFGISYYFLCYYTYVRFSMTVRENFVICVGIFLIYLLIKLDIEDRITARNSIMMALILSFLIGSHMLVALIVGSVFILYAIYKLFMHRFDVLKNLGIMGAVSGLISLPFIVAQYNGVIAQLTRGYEFIEQQGLSLSRAFINSEYFNLPIDILIIGGGLLFFIWFARKAEIDLGRNRVFLIFVLTILIGILLSLIPQFGMKQNRFAIYMYMILAFLLICFFIGLNKTRLRSIIIPIFLVLVISTAMINVSSYNGYFPINEKNIEYLDSQTELIIQYDIVYAGGTAQTALSYLGIRNNVTSFKEQYEDIPDHLDGVIVLMYEDVLFYKNNYDEIYQKFISLRELNYPIFDERSRTYIILPN